MARAVRSDQPAESRRAWAWPVAIIVGLMVVVGVNLTFIYIAVSGADEVVPSYVEEER